ncbi:MAG TPA: hypothetical protein VML55_24600 [Planctomycetaceae bacterium]|nr:hypothetical protein [Planctomycetaceae bacterium]
MEPAEATRPQPPDDESLKNRLLRIYCRTLIVLGVYVFSTGPLYWACYEGLKDAATVERISELPAIGVLYYPIAWACQVPAIGRWFDWYVNLWL